MSDIFQKPTKRRVWLALAGIAIILVVLRFHSHGEPLERDLTAYAYTAHEMLNGEQLYTSVWEHKPPALYLAYMLAELLWGYRPLAITLLGIVFSLISLLGLFLFLRCVTGSVTALTGALFWALTSHSILLQANQPNAELFLNAFTLISFWSFARYMQSSQKRMLFVSGLALAGASLFKTIALFPMLALCVYMLFPIATTRKDVWFKALCVEWLVFFSPGLLVWGGVVLIFGLSGNLHDFYEIVFVFNRQYSGGILRNIVIFFSEPLLFFHKAQREVWALVLLSIAWLSVSQPTYGPLRRSFFLVVLGGIGVEVASPGRYYAHYYQLLLPMYAILAALFFFDMSRVFKAKGLVVREIVPGLLLAVTLIHLAFYQWNYLKLSPDEISLEKYGRLFLQVHTLAEGVRNMTSPCETVYAFGGESGIYYYAQRQAASPVFQIIPFIHSPQHSRDVVYTRILYDLQAAPPALFIWNSEFGILDESLFADFVATNYMPVATFNTYTIFEYRHRNPAPAC